MQDDEDEIQEFSKEKSSNLHIFQPTGTEDSSHEDEEDQIFKLPNAIIS